MKTKQKKQAFKRFLPYLSRYKGWLIASILAGIVSGIATVFTTLYIGKGIDTMLGKNQVKWFMLLKILLLLAMLNGIASLFQWLMQLLANQVAYRSVATLRQETFAHLDKLPIRYYDRTPQGNLISRFTNDLEFVSEACVALFNNIFTGLTIVILSLVSMLRMSPLLTGIVLITTPIVFFVTWLVAHTSQRYFAKQQNYVGDIASFVNEIVGNQKIVNAFQYQQTSVERFTVINEKLQKEGQKAQFISTLTNPSTRFIDHVAYTSIGLLGGLLLLNGQGRLTIGMISSFTIYSNQFSKPFIELSGITTQIQTAMAGLERIFTILDEPVEKITMAAEKLPEKIQGAVVFKDVSFAYHANQPLIRNFNLTVAPGETVAIVGQTGAGKSTLVNLLMRFYEVQSGEIYLDDVPINAYPRDTLRRSFGMVLQDTWLFDGTIRENLIFGNPEASDELIKTAAKAAKIDGFIDKLPQQYETMIGSQGIDISDGQRQLLTIARTMISKPAMLILDEATSSVDTLTELDIQIAFTNLMQGRTSFVIAHRLSTIKNADTILVMDHGEIVETGTHQELIKIPDGFYQQLYRSQFAPQ